MPGVNPCGSICRAGGLVQTPQHPAKGMAALASGKACAMPTFRGLSFHYSIKCLCLIRLVKSAKRFLLYTVAPDLQICFRQGNFSSLLVRNREVHSGLTCFCFLKF